MSVWAIKKEKLSNEFLMRNHLDMNHSQKQFSVAQTRVIYEESFISKSAVNFCSQLFNEESLYK